MTVTPATGQLIRRSVAFLAGVCDHATSRDNAGFSAATASIGHEVANLPDRYWEPGTYALAAQLVVHHRGQVEKARVATSEQMGQVIDIANGPAISREQIPDAWATLDVASDKIILSMSAEDSLYRLLKRIPGAYQPAGRGRVWAVPGDFAFALEGMLPGFECEDGVVDRIDVSRSRASRDQQLLIAERIIDAATSIFFVKFEYDADLVNQIKAIPGRRWESDCWSLPLKRPSAEAVLGLVADHGFVLTERAEALIPQAQDIEDVIVPKRMTITEQGNWLRFSFDYVPAWVNALKMLPKNLRKYDAEAKCWLVKTNPEAIEQLLEDLACCEPPAPAEAYAQIEQHREYGAPAP